MLDHAASEWRADLVKLVCGILDRNSITPPTPFGDRLIDIGLSSIDLVNLMLAVEAEFDLTIPQSELTIENFQSISAIIAMLNRLAGNGSSPR
jgi:acyl carrier protein